MFGVLGFGFVTYLLINVQFGILAMMASGVAVCLIIMVGAFRAAVAGDRTLVTHDLFIVPGLARTVPKLVSCPWRTPLGAPAREGYRD